MPEHVHVLYPNKFNYEMERILVALKKPVAVARAYLEKENDAEWLNRLMVTYPSRKVFRFWEPGGGFDRNIFKEKTVATIIEYIHNNPVRRELVASPTEWRWSSARYWEGMDDMPLRMDEPFV